MALTDEVETEAKDVVAEADAKDESVRAEASKDGEAKDVVAEADAKDESVRAEASKDGGAKTDVAEEGQDKDAGTKAAGNAEGRQAA